MPTKSPLSATQIWKPTRISISGNLKPKIWSLNAIVNIWCFYKSTWLDLLLIQNRAAKMPLMETKKISLDDNWVTIRQWKYFASNIHEFISFYAQNIDSSDPDYPATHFWQTMNIGSQNYPGFRDSWRKEKELALNPGKRLVAKNAERVTFLVKSWMGQASTVTQVRHIVSQKKLKFKIW